MNIEEALFDSFESITTSSLQETDRHRQFLRLFQTILEEALADESIHFTSLFSKIAYLGVRYELKGSFLYELHFLRKHIDQSDHRIETNMLEYVIPNLIAKIWKNEIPKHILNLIPKVSGIDNQKPKVQSYHPHLKFACFAIDKSDKTLVGYIDEFDEEELVVRYDISDRNERFTSSIERLEYGHAPILIELIEVEVRDENILYPAGFVIEPDFLIDVTSIANCFNHAGTRVVSYSLKKFLPMTYSPALLIGNVANYFLDVIVGNPQLKWKEALQNVFALDPLAWASLDDDQTRKIIQDIKNHFKSIQYAVNQVFPQEGINPDSCYLEPTFYSAQYGIQGRLDLLQKTDDNYTIVELKSGSIFKPNAYGVKNDHYTQTLLYDLLIRSSFPGAKPKNYILYSKLGIDNLKLAPRIAAQQKEALKVRNDILFIEDSLANASQIRTFLNRINTHFYEDVKGYEANDIEHFEKVYGGLTDLEKDYFDSFVSFIAWEHRLAKIGEFGEDKSNGLAGLWLDSIQEKMHQFEMIAYLEIASNESMLAEPILSFRMTKDSNRLSNFRIGDIAVLYPINDEESSLRNQVFKCSIIDLTQELVIVRLRSQQRNQSIFQDNALWALEHDTMDSGFLKLYQQLFAWAGSIPSYRQLILGQRSPLVPESTSTLNYESLSQEQNATMQSMINAEEYFLVWGPPGTGKTSRIISHYVKSIFENTNKNIYVLAYTNRAVDEICDAIFGLGKAYESSILRIGSRYSTKLTYVDNLLSQKIIDVQSRKDLKTLISGHRIVVGTLSSILGKPMIFDMIPPSEVIIDEASQIIEPGLIGLLQKFSKFILVGDHRQLPAVVVQDPEQSKMEHIELQELGLWDRRDSLFERLYRRSQEKKWDHAIGLLSQQGRMHENIMAFASEQFYDSRLNLMPGIERLTYAEQQEGDIFQQSRMLFIDTPVRPIDRFSKTNQNEVEEVIHLLKIYRKLGYQDSEIGIITPFRAQIAAIREAMEIHQLDALGIQVDTVERYQGSARDIIIISFCANNPFQMKRMVSLSYEGIDRKLNVALTRAREKLIILGDESIMRPYPLYNELIDRCVKQNPISNLV